MTGRYERVEVITGVARRRRWSAGEKLRMVNELSRPGATVSLVARRNDINSSLLFKWRKLAREGAFGALPDGDAGFVPVRLAPASAARVAPVAADEAAAAPAAGETSPVVEIALPNGCRLRIPADLEASSLHRLVTVLKTAV
jgi:transposase